MRKNETYEIISAKIVDGEKLNPKWKTPMQIVVTDKGTFIDNITEEQFGFFKVAKPGHNWQSEIGKRINNIRIFKSRGYKWINWQ